MNNDKVFIERIRSKEVAVGIIGMGYVGLPLAIEFADKGFPVIGFDIDSKKTEAINSGRSYIKHIAEEKVALLANSSKCGATTDFSRLREMDCILICVPTPLTQHNEPDMQYIIATVKSIARYLRAGQLVVLESTTYPGTTSVLVRDILEETGLKAGEDFYLAFSPEREDPGNKNFSTKTITKVVGGYSSKCGLIASALYDMVISKTYPVSNTDVAEATKLLENIFRSVNIALVNELKVVFDKMGIDIWEVIAAASTKPFGYMPFFPGPGLGGHCIPIDPFYLSWKAKEYNINTRFIELAGEINTSMPMYVVCKVKSALNDINKSVKDSNILLLGIAYKPDVDDDRESPSYKLLDLLLEQGANVSYHDPFVPQIGKTRKYDFSLSSVVLNRETLAAADAVVISTAHSCVDYELVARESSLVIDTRNCMSGYDDIKAKIIKA